jgi:hypothetical protein
MGLKITKPGSTMFPTVPSKLELNERNIRLVAAIAMAAVALGRFARAAAYALAAPTDIGVESPNLFTIRAIRAGLDVYSPDFFAAPPFGLTIYTPLYHYLVAAFPPLANEFVLGRSISLVFMAASGLLVFAVTTKRDWIYGAIGLALFALLWPVTRGAAVVRSDSLGLFLSALPVVLVARNPEARRNLGVAALIAAAAFTAKQSFIAAPIACFCFLVGRSRRSAILFGAAYSLFLSAFLIGGYAWWGEGFFLSIFGVAGHQMSALFLLDLFRQVVDQHLAFVLALVSLAGVCTLGWKEERAKSPFPYYVAASWMVCLLTGAKLGASINYFIEPFLAGTLYFVFYAPDIQRQLERRRLTFALVGVASICVVMELAQARFENYSAAVPADLFWRRMERDARNRAILALDSHPRVLDLAHSTISSGLPGEVSLPDLYLYAAEWRTNALSEAPVVRLLNDQYFSAIVTTEFVLSTHKEPFVGLRWTNVVRAATNNYPCRLKVLDNILLVSKQVCDKSASRH